MAAEAVSRAGWSLATLASTGFVYWDWHLLAEVDLGEDEPGDEMALRHYAWGLDKEGVRPGAGGVGGLLMVSDDSAGKSYLALNDYIGNVCGLADPDDGSIAACYEYDPFGRELRATGSYAAANPIRFSSQYTDSETGLVYFGFRYYLPNWGRFLTRDPIEEEGGGNLYRFVSNDPVNRWDLLGLEDESEAETTSPEESSATTAFVGLGAFLAFGWQAEVQVDLAVSFGPNLRDWDAGILFSGGGGLGTPAAGVDVHVGLVDEAVSDQEGYYTAVNAVAGPLSVSAIENDAQGIMDPFLPDVIDSGNPAGTVDGVQLGLGLTATPTGAIPMGTSVTWGQTEAFTVQGALEVVGDAGASALNDTSAATDINNAGIFGLL